MTTGDGETYEAFKARRRREFNIRHGRWTEATQQKLLRVHLRHFLLTVGAEVEQRAEACNGMEKQDAAVSTTTVSHSFANEQKRLAKAREEAKARRHRSARTIQKFVRRRIRSMQQETRVENNEEELPSTSVLVALKIERPAEPLAIPSVITPMDVHITPTNSPPKAALPPYEVVIELVAARDLALASSGGFGDRYIEVELLLKRQSAVIARVAAPRQFVSSFQDNSSEMLLQNCVLRFGNDLNSGMRHGIASPHGVIDECSASIIVKVAGSNGGSATSLGVVGIPLSLLETPLAIQYALCRWFPLERAYPGHTARGDLRVSVCYLMRETSFDSVTMVPYMNPSSPKRENEETRIQEQKKAIARKAKRKPTAAIAKRTTANKALQRERASQDTQQMITKSEKVNSPAISLKDSLASPIGRISRAEALSPPSSPSSVASSEVSESLPAPDSPKVKRSVKTSRSFFPPKKSQKTAESSPPKDEEQEDSTKENLSRSPAKFLKRKPYKVVFHKLDWSGVTSKTNSNWSTSVNSRANTGVAPRPSKTSRSASRVSSTSSSSSQETATNCNSIPSSFIDAGTAQRLKALESVILERCGVTQDSASLARIKFQSERKKFVATLQNQARSTGPDLPPSQGSSERVIGTTTTDEAVTELWKELSGDSSGQIYAAMLRGFTERQPALLEPTNPVDW